MPGTFPATLPPTGMMYTIAIQFAVVNIQNWKQNICRYLLIVDEKHTI